MTADWTSPRWDSPVSLWWRWPAAGEGGGTALQVRVGGRRRWRRDQGSGPALVSVLALVEEAGSQ